MSSHILTRPENDNKLFTVILPVSLWSCVHIAGKNAIEGSKAFKSDPVSDVYNRVFRRNKQVGRIKDAQTVDVLADALFCKY
jgi:hypothetical protein